MILDSMDKLQGGGGGGRGGGGKNRLDVDSIFDFLSKIVATNIEKDTLADSILQLITLKVLVSKKTPNGYDSLYLSNID